MAKCKAVSCRAPIIWAKTPNGKMMPFDLRPSKEGEWSIDFERREEPCAKRLADTRALEPLYTPHWLTCPEAKTFSTKGRREGSHERPR